MLAVNTSSRSPRAIGLIAAAASTTGLILGDPVKDAACLALSTFSLCSDNTELKTDVNNLLQQQTVFQKTLKEDKLETTKTSTYWEIKCRKHKTVQQKVLSLETKT